MTAEEGTTMGRKLNGLVVSDRTPVEDDLALAIARGFLVTRGKYSPARDEFWRHCEEACLPFIEVTLRRDRAYLRYDHDPTYRHSCGFADLAPEEFEKVNELLTGAATPRCNCVLSPGGAAGGLFYASKLLEVLPQIVRIAHAASARFCVKHPNAGERAFCPHLSERDRRNDG